MKLIKYQIFVFITFLFFSPIVNAQNLDKIIDKHIKAHGGIEAWEKIENIKVTGRFTAFSIEEDFYAIKTKDGKYYSELYLGKHKVQEAFNGKTGWTIDPWQEILFPRELKKSEINVFYQKAEFFTPFYKYKERGFKVQLMDNQEVDGMEMIVLKLTRIDGMVETWYLDAKTYLEYKCKSNWVDFTYGVPSESYFDDFRTVNGVVLPFFIERTFWQRDRILQIENIDFNVDIDESIFEMPKSDQMKWLSFMEGNWDVKVDVMTRRGTWYTFDSTSSKIYWDATNLLIEKISYDLTLAQNLIINYSYNSTAGKYVMTRYNGLQSEIQLFDGEYTDSSYIFHNINVDYGDTTLAKTYSRINIYNVDKDSFDVEISVSGDQGGTWSPRQKLSYIRKFD